LPGIFDIFFYLFATAIVASAVLVCFSRNIVHAAFALLVTFFGVAGIYVLLSADFLAVSQILIYVGGILVLLVFGVMLTNRVTNIDLRSALSTRIPAFIICGGLLVLLVSFLRGRTDQGTSELLADTTQAHWIKYDEMPWKGSAWNKSAIEQATAPLQGSATELMNQQGSQGTSAEIGKLLLTDYLLPFEVISIVLLVALIGAVMMVRKDEKITGEEAA
jgi:NADH-quinone oxidoreductase subunit J